MNSILCKQPESIRQTFAQTRALSMAPTPQFQVLDPVVRTIHVAMMHRLTRKKLSAKMALHHFAMFKYLFSITRGATVAIFVDVPRTLRFLRAFHATKLLTMPKTLIGFVIRNGELLVAMRAILVRLFRTTMIVTTRRRTKADTLTPIGRAAMIALARVELHVSS